MMVAVDEARQDHMVSRSQHRKLRMRATDIVVLSDRDDRAVALVHGAVLHDFRFLTVPDASDNPFGSCD